ncbi:MAG: hypothetical protein IT437_02900 [Phycisphaerales bacterium]|nr:hypothetical protein [Phycisphaerales bacterium]
MMMLDLALDGNGAIPYPLRPLDPNNPGQNVGPDEHLALSGFSLGSNHDWHIKLALMMPTGNWDFTCARGQVSGGLFLSDRIWPLFTLWTDSTHYIEFLADCEHSRYLLRIKNGSGPIAQVPFGSGNFWLPDAPLLVSLAYNGSTHSLTVGASLGGDQVQAYTLVGFVPASVYETLKFRGAVGGYSGDGEVCELRIFGGLIDSASNFGAGSFSDLAFLL